MSDVKAVSHDGTAGVPEAPRVTRNETRVLPYGGDKAVARTIAECHRRKPWTARCRGCGEPWPCRDRIDAERVIAPTEDPADG